MVTVILFWHVNDAARTSSTFISIEAIKTTDFNDFPIDFFSLFIICEMSFVAGNYESMFRVDGKPILPPVVNIFCAKLLFAFQFNCCCFVDYRRTSRRIAAVQIAGH